MKHFGVSNLAILCSARNVGKYINRIYNVLNLSTRNFKSVTFFVVESYSNDDTIKKLQSISQTNSKFNFQTLKKTDAVLPPLPVRIAEARNFAADMARESRNSFDFVMVADLDNVNRDITSNRVESCWQYKDWNMMSANQPFAYYDTWALRHPILSPGDCWRDFDNLLEYFDKKEAFRLAVQNRVVQIPTHSKPIPVISAFGGLAIYDSESYFPFRYSGMNANGVEICEHVSLHREMLDANKRLFINPFMVNLNPFRQRFFQYVSKVRQIL